MDASTPDGVGTNLKAGKLLLTAEQVATSLAICRTKVYELLRNGELESVRSEPAGAYLRMPSLSTCSGCGPDDRPFRTEGVPETADLET